MYNILMASNDIKPKSIDYWLPMYPDVNINFDLWFKIINMQKLGQWKSLDFNWKMFDGHIHVNTEIKLKKMKPSGGRLNKKDGLTRYGDSHVKDKTS